MTINTRTSLRNTLFAGYSTIAVLLGVFGGWAALSDINSAVIASATIIVESFSKRVQHQDGGIVSKILVKDGDRVTEGQPLIILDPTDSRAELAIIQGSLDELTVKKARLESQRDGKDELQLPEFVASKMTDPAIAAIVNGQLKLLQSTLESMRGKREQLRQQISQLKEQISGIESQIDAKKQQSKLIAEELAGLKKLESRGLVPKSRVLGIEREQARLAGEDGELRASKATAQNRIGEVELRVLQLEEDLRTEALTELRDVETKIAELVQRRGALSLRVARTNITAPITGTVYQMAVHTEGGVIGGGDTLMLIVPEGDDLVLQAQITPNDRDDVQPGQTAQVRFPSFNARVTPEILAEVQQVSADVSRVDANSPPFYTVRLVISAKELKKLGKNRLQPGMNAEVFIQTGARSPLSYLLKPLIDQFSHAMRET